MTWKEFKDLVDKLVPDDTEINYIDVTAGYIYEMDIHFNEDGEVDIS